MFKKLNVQQKNPGKFLDIFPQELFCQFFGKFWLFLVIIYI